jgi:hypothetical protein
MLAVPLILASCSSSKKAVKEPGKGTEQPTVVTDNTNTEGAAVSFVRKINANAVNAKNIVSSIDFNLKSGSKDITVDGKIMMRRDEVIRIQLTPLGLMEVGRLEFTPETVLIIDRVHKQYVKVAYGEVSFLKNNGIDFNSLQAFFWNQLFVPGSNEIGDKEINQFSVSGNNLSVTSGKMKYLWTADPATAQIKSARATYDSGGKQSSLDWKYDVFKNFQSGSFPTNHTVKIDSSSGKVINVTISMGNLKTDSKWDAITEVSSKYKPVQFQEVINQIMKLK